jgi:hypothetical protein
MTKFGQLKPLKKHRSLVYSLVGNTNYSEIG